MTAELAWPRIRQENTPPVSAAGHDRTAGERQELQSVKRRTKEGLERAREQGKVLGPPRKFRPNQVETMRRMRERGASLRRIASDFECSASTVMRALQREGVAS